MSTRMPTGTEEERSAAVMAAARAINRGQLVVFPTDTVYGLAADAFDADAVRRLLAAKGRGRSMPPPVLIGNASTVDALLVGLPAYARGLINRFWPGPLTLVGRQQTSLRWDLGDTRGTVAVRMPDDDVACAILERTGPLAVTSANLTGSPPATTPDEAEAMLGASVAVVIDDGSRAHSAASTIVDVTTDRPRLLRLGALDVADLNDVLAEHDLTLDEG